MTMAALINRLRTQWLEPPDELWPRTVLTAGVNDAATTLPVDLALLTAEEQHLIGAGMLAQVGSEEVLLKSLTDANATVVRAIRGSVAAAHLVGTEVFLAPPWTRAQMFDALRDAVVALHPALWTVATTTITVGDKGVTEIPAAVVTPVKLRSTANHTSWSFEDLGQWTEVATSRALLIHGINQGTEGLLQYRGKFGYATAEADTLGFLGLRDEWADIACIKAAAVLIGSHSLSARQQEFVSRQLASESYPVDSPGRLRDALLRLYVFRRDEAANALSRTHRTDVQMQLSP